MKTTLKLLSLLLVGTFLSIFLLACGSIKEDSHISKHVLSSESNYPVKTPIPPTSAPAPKASPTPSPVVYDIRGDLSNFDSSQKNSSDKWRKDIVESVRNGDYKNVFINGPTDKGKTVALTFDDCPDAKNTAKVLDILQSNNIKATFFMIGQNVSWFPTVTKRAYNEGNLVLSHSYTHPYLTQLKKDELINELTLTDNIIYKTIGKKPAIIRPPYGDVNKDVIDLLNDKGYKTIIWSTDSLDWANPGNESNVSTNVLDNIRPGDIILMHGYKDVTVNALPGIIKQLKEKGYQFEKIDEMLGIEAYRQ